MAFPVGWTKKHPIVIDHTKVAGTTNLTNYVILLTEANFQTSAFDNSDNGGGDLRFSSDAAGATQLACDVVTWDNGATNKAEVHVLIPTVDCDDNTTFYVWFGNTGQTQPARDAAYGSDAVWADYEGVWHFNNNYNDSSPNAYNLSNGTAPTYTTSGMVGGAYDYDNSDYIKIAAASCPNLDITGSRTVQGWYKGDSQGDRRMFSKGGGGLDILYTGNVDGHWNFLFQAAGLTTSYYVLDTRDVNNGSWYLVHGVYDSSATALDIWVNGTQTGGFAHKTASGSSTSCTGDFEVGRYTTQYMDGVIDELRISNVPRSGDWCLTEYNNQSSPSTFCTEGTVESPSTSPSLSPSVSESPSVSPSEVSSESPSLSPSVSESPSVSPSVSISPSLSPSVSESPSLSPSVSESPSVSPSLSPSVSVSPSLSPSVSVSPSLSPSVSMSPSLSPSVSTSPSLSPSVSESPSESPSYSPSVSVSPSLSPSVSVSPSVSPSVSTSPSLSPSVSESPSASPSVSESPSVSPSPSPGFKGYSRGDYETLPADDSDLETMYSEQDYLDVETLDAAKVRQDASGTYAIHQFKDYVASDSATFSWKGICSYAPGASEVILELYNRTATEWQIKDTDNVTGADTTFELRVIMADLSDYKDNNNVVSSRVYQRAI